MDASCWRAYRGFQQFTWPFVSCIACSDSLATQFLVSHAMQGRNLGTFMIRGSGSPCAETGEDLFKAHLSSLGQKPFIDPLVHFICLSATPMSSVDSTSHQPRDRVSQSTQQAWATSQAVSSRPTPPQRNAPKLSSSSHQPLFSPSNFSLMTSEVF